MVFAPNRPTSTSREVTAGCYDCSGSEPRWSGGSAQGTAARHHDATKHATWCNVHMSVRYGREAADPRQIDLEESIAAAGAGDQPAPAPLPAIDAPAVAPAGVSAPEGRSSRRALAAIQRPEPDHV